MGDKMRSNHYVVISGGWHIAHWRNAVSSSGCHICCRGWYPTALRGPRRTLDNRCVVGDISGCRTRRQHGTTKEHNVLTWRGKKFQNQNGEII